MTKVKKRETNLIYRYLRNDKLKLFLYLLLVFTSYFPTLGAAFFWGLALENLIQKNMEMFVLYLAI